MSVWLTAEEIIRLTGYKTSRRQISVTVWGEVYEVRVYQKSKAVWEAAGSYAGEWITVPGSSESSAIRHWEKAARYRG
jgi:hypothetical protein